MEFGGIWKDPAHSLQSLPFVGGMLLAETQPG